MKKLLAVFAMMHHPLLAMKNTTKNTDSNYTITKNPAGLFEVHTYGCLIGEYATEDECEAAIIEEKEEQASLAQEFGE